MTKIYVVLGRNYVSGFTWISNVFTNKKKADSYKAFISQQKQNVNDFYEVYTEKIDNLDYGKLLKHD